MSGYVLVIDDQGRVESLLTKVFAGTSLTLESFHDPLAAKRHLVVTPPRIVISLTAFQNHPEGGFRLAEEFTAHEQLASIPVVLVTEQLTEDIIAHASRSGAKALVPWPVSVESFRNRLRPFLEDEFRAKEVAAVPLPSGVETAVAATPNSSVTKIQLAQQLLAKVLHNLKTSALLEVVDTEDVPRVVLEITRAVCSPSVPEQKLGETKSPAAPDPTPKPQSEPKGSQIALDLDAAFGRKK